MVVSPVFLRNSTSVSNDQLSEVFDLVEVSGVVSGGFAARGPWVSGGAVDGPLKLIAMLSGRAGLTVDAVDEPIRLEGGDVVLLNGRSSMDLRGGAGEGPAREVRPDARFDSTRVLDAYRDGDDVVIGGRIHLNPAGRILLQALPPVAHVRASATEATNLRGTLYRLFDEVTADRIGSAFAIRQYVQLLLLEVLRAYVDQAELPPGWLRLAADDRLRPALLQMHAEPGRPWRLDDLARAATMSRTTFAERFRTTAGVPPLTYLHRWRVLLAQRALREGDVRVGRLAADLGYSSESAFSTAFKREVGQSPLRYRASVRCGQARWRTDR
jgi:AraC-like DNA-binding protein